MKARCWYGQLRLERSSHRRTARDHDKYKLSDPVASLLRVLVENASRDKQRQPSKG